MAIKQDVNININANTAGSEQQISNLENKVRTLDGAINLVGGSIAALAGGLALSGAVTEEQAERFETAAIGAIALAEGTKRALDGFKTLAENTKILTAIQRVYNTVMAANPLFLIVGVIAAVTVGVIALSKALKSQREEQERINKLESDQTYLRLQERSLKLAELRGESALELAKRQTQIAKQQSDIAQAEFLAAKGTEEKAAAQQKYNAAWDNYLIALEKEKIAIKESNEAAATQADMMKTRAEGGLDLKRKEIEFNAEVADSNLQLVSNTMLTEKARTEILEAEAAKRRLVEENNAKLAIATLDTIQAAAGVAFENNKAIASANVIVDAGQAALGILNTSYKNVDPTLVIAYQVAQFALLTATTVKSLQAINSASPTTGGSTAAGTNYGAPTGGGFGLSGPGFALGAPQTGGTSGVTTLNAVVLAGDVTSAQAQEAAIRNRRRFG